MTPTRIVIHCSAVTYGTAAGIDKFHRETNGWDKIGYHYVIENGLQKSGDRMAQPSRDGWIINGRAEYEDGAHAFGLNSEALGVCLIGLDRFTRAQLVSLYSLLISLCIRWNIDADQVIGHYETPHEAGKPTGRKSCPNLNMPRVRAKLRTMLGLVRQQMLTNGEQKHG